MDQQFLILITFIQLLKLSMIIKSTVQLLTKLRSISASFCNNSSEYFAQSKQFWRPPSNEPVMECKSPDSVEKSLLSYLYEHCPKNNPAKTLEFIDKYCLQNWMMNFGPEKSKIFQRVISQNKISKILQIGTYCGYSAIALSQCKLELQNKIVSLQINKGVAQIAKKIITHAGIKNINVVSESMYEAISLLNEIGPFDLVFMDQEERQYITDLKFLEERNLIKTGSIIIADNTLYPGAPEYVAFMRQCSNNQKYKSILYHTYDAYSDIPDGVLVSRKIY